MGGELILVILDYREIGMWEDVSEDEWNDWRWQIANRITTVETLKEVVPLSPEEEQGVGKATQILRMAITPYFATLIDRDDPNCPIRQQAVPTSQETDFDEADMLDPLDEDADSPAPGVTHRYPDRVMWAVTDRCSMYCRHCTRRRYAGNTDGHRPQPEIEEALDWLARKPEVRDVLVSGGDPLLLSDEYLAYLLEELRKIPHVEIIRLGTRVPVVLPQRITQKLVDTIRQYHPVWLNTQFNHPNEITPETQRAFALMADAGIPLGNQSVLLRGINDCPLVMRKLVHGLLQMRVRPYYVYQCDLSPGIGHFRSTVSSGIQVIESLRGHTSGLAVPTFVVDAPGGGGKIPLNPQYLISMDTGKVVLRNYEGHLSVYHEPVQTERWEDVCPLCGTDHSQLDEGVIGLLSERETDSDLDLEPTEDVPADE